MSERTGSSNGIESELTTRRGALAAIGTAAGALVGTGGTASAASSDDVDVLIDPEPPIAGEETTFTSTIRFQDHEWVIVGPTGFQQSSESTVSVTFEEAGEYTAYLSVDLPDDESAYVTASGQVLESRDVDPTANIEYSPQDPVYNPITFDASGSTTPAGEIESYGWYYRNVSANPDWDVFDGSPDRSGETLEMGFSEGNTYQVGLEVTNSAGNTDRTRVEFTPEEHPDAPDPVIDIYPEEITPPNPVTLDASESTTPVGSIESYEWKISKYDDDNEHIEDLHRSGEVVEEHWEADVLHTVTLTVENTEGVSNEARDNFRPEPES